jgi:transketolase
VSSGGGRPEMRRVFGETLVAQGRADPRIVVLDNDSGATTLAGLFEAVFPNRYFDVGIAEKNLFGTAAGLAASGYLPVAATFAVFATRCALDQIAISISYPALNVKIPGHYVGASRAGASHTPIEDLAVMRTLPNMRVADPADNAELVAVMEASLEVSGPVYYRVSKLALPDVFESGHKFEWGHGQTLRSGSDVSIMSTGMMTSFALDAAAELAAEGISAEVIHLGSIKPIDEELIAASAARTGCVVSAENHSIIGGLGAAVAEVLAERHPVPMRRIGYRDVWQHSGSLGQVLEAYRLRPVDIAEAAREVVEFRRTGEAPSREALIAAPAST